MKLTCPQLGAKEKLKREMKMMVEDRKWDVDQMIEVSMAFILEGIYY